jgi:hypothetical protein
MLVKPSTSNPIRNSPSNNSNTTSNRFSSLMDHT